MDAVEGWEKKARLLLLLHSIFEDGEQAVAYIRQHHHDHHGPGLQDRALQVHVEDRADPELPSCDPKDHPVLYVEPSRGGQGAQEWWRDQGKSA